jgi:hypothetical protein
MRINNKVMPQFAISSTPISAITINNAIYNASSATMGLNDRFPRMYVRKLTNQSLISYLDFLNTPGFLIQAGTSINLFMVNNDGGAIILPVSNNFPGIIPGDAFTVVVGAELGWTERSPVTHHGFIYGNAQQHILVNGDGRKRWFTRTTYDGGNTVTINGFYSGDETNFPYARMYLLAVRFRINQTGWATGDGNSVSTEQTGFFNTPPSTTIQSYVNNWPQNTSIQHSLIVATPPPDIDPESPGGGGG